ncbi:helix-turn-helix domain-containing protein [Streptomyces sp. C11-1]|uniref:Helix-turn-helix domain-containing protein n=1 Tax=Streptomyces durocortorensis TaxID=2811104 RepID=A0ABY9W2S6_9ACTN|nr:helix-turn-helix domain-containing protein [Streptomyces durocortorensis]WNF30447.1 helix-turn-helix domain-containing protein [Streptomyces durocortorensis]
MRRETRYEVLLGPLLAGRNPPDLVERAARALGLPERGRYAVVVLDSPEPGPSAATPGPDPDGTRWCWCGGGDASGREVAVVLLGPAGPARAAAWLRERGAGPGGVSPVVGSLAELAAAHRLAGTALLTCEPGSREIVRLDERLPAALLVSRPELSTRLLAEVFGPLLTLAPAERSLLVGTLEAWLECGGSAGRAAARLRCHRNTVCNRLRRLEGLTGRSLSRPRELVDLVLALDALRLTSAPP